ncbi:hypothetical protein DYE50_00495 [Treponema ruminis]|uniref:Lipoprotein n=1 Tax=Treponema ruminis TaxID=744515 RepID=A0A7W8LL77_9SPIR|nr:hypothetical protein [Treponema ruminis]MBB5225139.1 hypothetical protein [Treponema ruminis]QSI01060.1 hypothetical protein DYE50_00495 [Treponema ruminis]
MKKILFLLFFVLSSSFFAQEYGLISNARDYMVLINKSGNDDTFRIKIRVPRGSRTSANADAFSFSLDSKVQNEDRFATYMTCTLKNGEKKKSKEEFDWNQVDLVKVESKSGKKYTLNMYCKFNDLYIEILPYEDW